MIKELIKLADHLDKKGFYKEANYIDLILKMGENEGDKPDIENAIITKERIYEFIDSQYKLEGFLSSFRKLIRDVVDFLTSEEKGGNQDSWAENKVLNLIDNYKFLYARYNDFAKIFNAREEREYYSYNKYYKRNPDKVTKDDLEKLNSLKEIREARVRDFILQQIDYIKRFLN